MLLLSDHSFITADSDLGFKHGASTNVIRRRQWRHVDFDQLSDDLSHSSLLNNPPTDADGLFACYDETLRSLVDKHAPFADVKLRAHSNAPWFDNSCRLMKVDTRRLERIYRRYKTDITYRAWREQFKRNRAFLQDRFTQYWTEAITANTRDSKAQWSKINALLKVPTVSSSNDKHSATDLSLIHISEPT